MFLARSAFWLTGAFIIMAPSAGMDIGSSARSTGASVLEQGSSVLVGQIAAQECASLECNVGRQLLLGALPPAQTRTVAIETDQGEGDVSFPPRRPDWAY